MPAPESKTTLMQLCYHWFIEYNPLYFFSACCILFGMFLISRELTQYGWQKAQIVLSLVLQVYELMLITGAALLVRLTHQRRPAVILSLLAIFFMIDCTWQSECLAMISPFWALLWAALIPVKIMALGYAFRLKLTCTHVITPVAAGVGVTGFPLLIQSGQMNTFFVNTAAAWFGAYLVFFLIEYTPPLRCDLKLTNWGQTVLRRLNKAVCAIWFMFYAYHYLSWPGLFNIPFSPSYFTPIAIGFIALFKKEYTTWIWSSVILGLALIEPPTMTWTSLALAPLFAWLAWRRNQRRLLLGMLCALYIGCWTWGWNQYPLPASNLVLDIMTAAILIFIAWRLQMGVAFIPLIVGVIIMSKDYLSILMLYLRSLTKAELGMLLLLAGFASLVIGVAVNWNQRRNLPADHGFDDQT